MAKKIISSKFLINGPLYSVMIKTPAKKTMVFFYILMQYYPPRALDRKLQEDWVRDAREGPRVLMSLRVDFGLMG